MTQKMTRSPHNEPNMPETTGIQVTKPMERSDPTRLTCLLALTRQQVLQELSKSHPVQSCSQHGERTTTKNKDWNENQTNLYRKLDPNRTTLSLPASNGGGRDSGTCAGTVRQKPRTQIKRSRRNQGRP
jgi:hypothetical protein